jgi:hypothetical protein
LSHFSIGLAAENGSNGLTGWMPNSGVPWDYASTYLSGGANTGQGWSTWSNGNGSYALNYAQTANSHRYIPAFSYYMLWQSNGSCNSCSERQRDLSNLNTPSTMGSFYQDFTLLMQRLGSGTYGGVAGYGKTAIVHVEPDLSGYAEQAVLSNSAHCYGYCTAQGNNPAYLAASVASSGAAAAASYPNTYQGFNWALLHLRDLYAPNVLLAFHVSGWATGPDVDGDTSLTLNASALGQEAGSFVAQSGIAGNPTGLSTWNVVFNDVANRDAGHGGTWWDRLNITFPNFSRWENYIAAIAAASARSVIVWQLPMGNQYFDTENNSTHHYQDNHADYFFGHIGELASHGISGMIFGSGTSGNTSYWDADGDGTVNPPSFCTSAGLSSGVICDNHVASVADDDGGYIRQKAQQYYAGGGYAL